MSENANAEQMMSDRKLCVNGCGFFGSSSTSDMCSKCWRDTVNRQQQQLVDNARAKEAAVAAPPVPPSPTAAPASVATPPLPPAAAAEGAASASTAASVNGGAADGTAPMVIEGAPSGTESVLAEAAAAAAAGAIAETAGVTAAAAVTTTEAEPAEPAQRNRKRCFTCNKKIGLTGIECRCKLVFCGVHRYPEQHGCAFDFKTADRATLANTVKGGGQFSKVERL